MSKPIEKKYNFTFKCDESGEMEHVNGTPSTFKCPHCGLLMKYVEKTRKLGAHGRTDETLGHKMRVAEELA